MPRGSKPGERRGGRQRATPNRRTVLTNRIMAAAAASPVPTANELVLVLAKDQALPADTRMAIARKVLLFGPPRSMHSSSAVPNGHRKPPSKPVTKNGADRDKGSWEGGAIVAKAGLATDLLFAIAQDITADAADRRRAASRIAEFFLPKETRGKKPHHGKFPPDECGFIVDPELARELRDSKMKLSCLELERKRTPHAFAQKARNLHARIEEIWRSLQCLCPSKYGKKQINSDNERLKIFADRRAQRELFSPEEDLEEARRMARRDSYRHGPEVMARTRLMHLRNEKRVAENGGLPITAAQATMFRFLALLYPSSPTPSPSQEEIEAHPLAQVGRTHTSW
jgi:hypothetical protein